MPDQQAARLAAKARKDGFDKVRKQNRAVWDELWKGRLRLEGAGEHWQSLADAAFFYLNTSVHSSSPASTSIFGLATWHDYHYYFGHVMWDIEAFAVPPLSVLQPEAAKALLDYRSAHLQGAKRNAMILGRRGLQFPWESAPRTGQEAAPLPGTAAWHEDHVSLDVARAFRFYGDVTGDAEFNRTQAWPVLAGVCEWITIRVSKTHHGYDIAESMGIAERRIRSTTQRSRTWAPSSYCVPRLPRRRPGFARHPLWTEIADGMAIPRAWQGDHFAR